MSDSTGDTSSQNTVCSNAQMSQILRSVLFVDTLKYNVDVKNRTYEDKAYYLSETVDSYVGKLEANIERSNMSSLLSQSQAAAAFDAVVAFALAYDEILKVDEFALGHRNISSVLNETLSMLQFNGLSSFHHLSKSQDMEFNILVAQFQSESKINPVLIISGIDASVNCSTCQVTYLQNSTLVLPGYSISDYSGFMWKGGEAPSDGFIVYNVSLEREHFIAAGCVLLLPLGVIATVAISLVLFHKNSHIRASSPKFMGIIVIGYLISLPAPFLFGFSFTRTKSELSTRVFDSLCIVEPILSDVGNFLLISVYTVKSWRVYRIFNNKRNVELKGMSDASLMLLLAILVTPHYLILAFWLIYRTPENVKQTIEIPSNIRVTYTYCGYFDGTLDDILYRFLTLLAYDFVVLALLLYFSYKNSRISRQLRAHAEEGQAGIRVAVGAAIFCFVVTAIFTILSTYNEVYVYFWIYIFSSMFSPFFCLGAVFLPKYIIMYRDYRHKKQQVRLSSHNELFNKMQLEASQLKKSIKEKDGKITLLRTQLNSVSSCHEVSTTV